MDLDILNNTAILESQVDNFQEANANIGIDSYTYVNPIIRGFPAITLYYSHGEHELGKPL